MTAGSEGPDRIAKNIYDNHGRLIEVYSGVGTTLVQKSREMVYRTSSTLNGQLRFVYDAEGNRTEYLYDDFGRLSKTLYPQESSNGTSNPNDYDSVTYDSAGRVDSFRTRAGEVFDFAYDNFGRLMQLDVPTRSGLASTHTRDVFYAYYLMGNLTQTRFDSHSGEGILANYNAMGQQLSSSNNMDGATRMISYNYDAAGRRDGITHPDSLDIAYNFDVFNRLTSIQRDGVNTLFAFDYDEEGRPTERTGYSDAPNQTYSYDAAGRLASLGVEDTGNTTYAADWTFAYNPAGQVTSETRDNDVFAFGNYFDDNGDPIHLGYTSNGLNQIEAIFDNLSKVTNTFAHHSNGNLTSNGNTTYIYDTETPARRDDGFDACAGDLLANGVCVIAPICQEGLYAVCDHAEQRSEALHIVCLARRQNEAERAALSIASGVELGGEAAARSTQSLCLLSPLYGWPAP